LSVSASIGYFLPELILAGAAIAVLIAGLFIRNKAVLGALLPRGDHLSIWQYASQLPGNRTALFKYAHKRQFFEFFKEITLLVMGLVILISIGTGRWMTKMQGNTISF
jgi:hypothetical protein